MYVVRNSKNEVEMLCTRLEDANAFLTSNEDTYTLEEIGTKELDEHIIRMAEMNDDGIGEGQVR